MTSGKKLDPSNKTHTQIIEKLRKNFGSKEHPEELTIENLNQGENLKILHKTLAVMLFATDNEPTMKDMGNYKLNINNAKLADLIKPNYDKKEFDSLLNTLNDHNVFETQTHPILGIPKTSDVTRDEDFQMGVSYWITDTCHNIKLMKDKQPNDVPKALKTIARFYKENESTIQKFINNPKENIRSLKSGNGNIGIPHIFVPEKNPKDKDGITLKPNEGMNRSRQESHGNALKTLVSGIRDNSIKKEDINKDIIDTIGNLVKYFEAIDYPNAPSNGNWEETPFNQGLTYDTAVITDALKETKILMENLNKSTNKDDKELKTKLISSKNGSILNDIQKLEKLIKIGEERIKKTYYAEAPPQQGCKTSREIDASQIFTIALGIKVDDDAEKDAQKKIEVLEKIEQNLGGDFGISRYQGDGYLGPDCDVAIDKEGKISLAYLNVKKEVRSQDCSNDENFKKREEICGGSKDDSAKWFFDPVMSRAYGKIKQELLDKGYKEDNKLVKKAFEKQTEYLNKGLARITGSKKDGTESIKANGHECKPWLVPEAYQSVTTLDKNGKPIAKFIPGRNTPLTWAKSELNQALNTYNL